MPVSVRAAASAMPRPRSATRESASSGERTPARAAAVNSPTLWPAVASTWWGAAGRDPSRAEAAASPAPTNRGWATAVSRISSASAVVP